MTLRTPLGRRGPAVVVMATGAATTVTGSLLPWLRSGGTRRHSYDVFRLVERLGFAPDGPAATALRWWPLVPVVAVAAVVTTWWGWPRAGGAVGVLAACYAGGVALAVATAPGAGQVIGIEPGAAVTAVGGAVLLVGSILAIVVGYRATAAPTRATPTDLAG